MKKMHTTSPPEKIPGERRIINYRMTCKVSPFTDATYVR